MEDQKKALNKILEIASGMLMHGINEEPEEWNLPKTTPKKAKLEIQREAEIYNELNRLRAIQLKEVHDTLSKYIYH